jgi:hypothetical protein
MFLATRNLYAGGGFFGKSFLPFLVDGWRGRFGFGQFMRTLCSPVPGWPADRRIHAFDAAPRRGGAGKLFLAALAALNVIVAACDKLTRVISLNSPNYCKLVKKFGFKFE